MITHAIERFGNFQHRGRTHFDAETAAFAFFGVDHDEAAASTFFSHLCHCRTFRA
jgi:hypothetical protein